MGRSLSSRRVGRIAGSFLAATAVAPAHASGRVETIELLRRQRLTGKAIAAEVRVSSATVSRVLRRLGLNKLSALEPEPVRRYERENPGELIHLDIKKLGKIGSVGHRITGRRTGIVNQHLGIGWEFVHVCIDDASRVAVSSVMKDERKESAVAFLKAAIAYYASLGVKIERVMTDNGSCYRSKTFAKACKQLSLKHIFTKPYTPKTNGKAERFIQTSLREWAYGRAYNTSDERTAELPRWLHRYNWHRPHGSIGSMPPITRTRHLPEQPIEAAQLAREAIWAGFSLRYTDGNITRIGGEIRRHQHHYAELKALAAEERQIDVQINRSRV